MVAIEEIGIRSKDNKSVAIAIEGCCHGKLAEIYDRLLQHQQRHETNDDERIKTEEIGDNHNSNKIDLLLCCGDFQSLRSPADFHSLAVPPKYRDLGSFYKYYTGEWTAPILTIFVGGNHEASQPLAELYYGGWVAPNMYYLGAAGVVRYRGIRIGGLSGIYKSHDFLQTRTETPPYDHSTLRSVYHYRNVEVYRLACLAASAKTTASSRYSINGDKTQTTTVDTTLDRCKPQRLGIVVTHDWPQGIEQFGDTDGLIRRKPFFRQEIADNSLGSPPAAQLLHSLQPNYWFAAHLHVKFRATVPHHHSSPTIERSNDYIVTGIAPEIAATTNSLIPSQVIQVSYKKQLPSVKTTNDAAADHGNELMHDSVEKECIKSVGPNDTPAMEETTNMPLSSTQFMVPESSSATCAAVPDLTDLMTQFLALDKCLPRRQYLSIVHIPVNESAAATNNATLEYDLEWLAVLRKTHHLSAATRSHRVHLPSEPQHAATDADVAWVRHRLVSENLNNKNNNDAAAMAIQQQFIATIPPHVEPSPGAPRVLPPPLRRMGNPQTDHLLRLLQLEHMPNLTIPYDSPPSPPPPPPPPQQGKSPGPFSADDENEIDLDDADIQDDAPAAFAPAEKGEIELEGVIESQEESLSQDIKKPRLDDAS